MLLNVDLTRDLRAFFARSENECNISCKESGHSDHLTIKQKDFNDEIQKEICYCTSRITVYSGHNKEKLGKKNAQVQPNREKTEPQSAKRHGEIAFKKD